VAVLCRGRSDAEADHVVVLLAVMAACVDVTGDKVAHLGGLVIGVALGFTLGQMPKRPEQAVGEAASQRGKSPI